MQTETLALHPALQIEDLVVHYKRGLFGKPHPAVRGVSLSIKAGEVVGFLGPNGAGKSSTIKSILGFITNYTGSIRVFGAEGGTNEAKARIGYLPEVALYYPFLTPLETLRLYGTLQGLSGKALEEEARNLLNKVGLSGKENSQLKTFSKGMQQRLGIAQALLGNPSLLVLDEVSSGLDPLGKRQLREVLEEVHHAGTTIFFSSHELSEVAQLCDRIIIINQGQIIAERAMDDELRAGTTTALEEFFITQLTQNNTTGKTIAKAA